jgi:hypothetical protein
MGEKRERGGRGRRRGERGKGKGGRERIEIRGEGRVEGAVRRESRERRGEKGKRGERGKGKRGRWRKGEMGEGEGRWKWEEAKGWGRGYDELVHDSSNGASDADWLRPVFAADTISDV